MNTDFSESSISLRSLWQRSKDMYGHKGIAVFIATAVRVLNDRYLNKSLRKIQKYFDGKMDRRYGLDTQGIIFPSAMPFTSPHKKFSCNYQPTTEHTFRHLMSYLPDKLAGFDFIDIGCGKGRVLFYAADWQFERIVGVEFAPPLAAFAKRNVALFAAATGDRRLEVRCEDAIDTTLPDGPCVFFFASPFLDPILAKMAVRIEASYRAHRRKIYVVYYDPTPIPDIVGRFNFLKPIARGAVWQDPLALCIYPYAIFESPD